MVTGVRATRHSLPHRLRRLRTRLKRGAVDYYRGNGPDWLPLAAALLITPALAVGCVLQPDWIPAAALGLPALIGGLLLRPLSLLLVDPLVAGALAVTYWALQRRQGGAAPIHPGTLLLIGVMTLIGAGIALFRARLGVPLRRGETMLFDLRERLRVQSGVPRLPAGWHAEAALRPAGGQSFSGDFVVCARPDGGRTLEIVLADVSGKGMDAASRALLLSGAFGGLLGSLPAESFLPAANAYLLRQHWAEGFATAVHLVLDLDDGHYQLRSAGHPPPVHRSAGSGIWSVREVEGPLLGVLDDVKFPPLTGQLEPGDILMLYSDGLVEAPGRDISDGVDRFVGAADQLVTAGISGGAGWLIDTVGKDVNDDRAVVAIWR